MECCVATTLRVHTLAKELGVPSKVIIAKCAAEGVELKNHMAAISVGLAESIREWFSVSADVTSVEVAERVDVEKVRVPRRRDTKAPEPAEVVAAEPTEPVPAVEMAPAGMPAPEIAPEALAGLAPVIDGTIVVVGPGLVVETVEAAGAEGLAAVAPMAPEVAEALASVGPFEPVVVTPPIAKAIVPPEPIRPAGPQLVPRPAELQGPRVVRVEAPEPDRYPRPRVGVGPARGVGERDTAPAAGAGAAATAAPKRGRGKGHKEEESDLNRARSRNPRRRSSATDVDQRVREWREQDLLERKERLAGVTGHGLRDRRAAERRRQATAQTGTTQTMRRDAVEITAPVALKEFCSAVGTPFMVVSKKLTEQTGRLWTINQSIDAEQVELLALDLGIPVVIGQARTAYEVLEDEFAQRLRPNLQPRPPVVAMLGHVDHGKTSLLDAIRHAHVAEGEAGGITQHIGAYRIDRGDWHVTFVDTPGHAAFTAMRARGADLTDVVVLVVAADDGVMPQTVEAINHARAAGVVIVVALNKIDLPGIDLNRIYAQLAAHDLTPSEWGGQTDVIKTSAVTGQGIDELVAHLSTLSELLELRADADVPAQATVIEAQMREGQGVVAQVLVREGTLRPGQFIVCGPAAGRIRALRDDKGRIVREVPPGTPVEVTGLDELPSAGDGLYQVASLSYAKEIAGEVHQHRRLASLDQGLKPRTLEALVQSGVGAEQPELNVILRADVQGSVEVLRKALAELPSNKSRLVVLHAAVGAITEADVNLAKASHALVLGFNMVAEDRARQLAEQIGVEIRLYRIIYELLDDLRKALAGLLEPEQRHEARATAEVREIFHVSRVGTVAGCYVTDGVVNRHHRVRLVRDGRIVVEGAGIGSLKRFKEDAREVRAGLECGIKIDGFDDIKPGDQIQTFEVVEVPQEI